MKRSIIYSNALGSLNAALKNCNREIAYIDRHIKSFPPPVATAKRERRAELWDERERLKAAVIMIKRSAFRALEGEKYWDDLEEFDG